MTRLIALLAGSLLLGAGYFTDKDPIRPENGGYSIGDTVDDFTLADTEGQEVSLSDYSGDNGVVVVFTCNSCPYAKAYEDRIIALHKNYASKGFPVLAVMPNDVSKKPEDSLENMKIRSREKDYGFSYVIDETQQVARNFGATRTPHLFLLSNDGDGEFTLEFIGALDNDPQGKKTERINYVEDAIAQLLNGEEVTKTEAVAVGCTIKWADK